MSPEIFQYIDSSLAVIVSVAVIYMLYQLVNKLLARTDSLIDTIVDQEAAEKGKKRVR